MSETSFNSPNIILITISEYELASLENSLTGKGTESAEDPTTSHNSHQTTRVLLMEWLREDPLAWQRIEKEPVLGLPFGISFRNL